MTDEQLLRKVVPLNFTGRRLDKALSDMFPDFSRSRLQSWIKQGQIKVDGEVLPAKYRLAGSEQIELLTKLVPEAGEIKPENIPIDIIFEDEEIIVINKPAGLVMHPGAGNWCGTVQNGLLHYDPSLAKIPRAGIVHRLDKDTTGLFVVARTLRAHKSLVEQLQAHHVSRNYLAIVDGALVSGGTINLPIGRHSKDRKRMTVRESGKEAITHYRLKEKFRAHTLLSVKLETGRTHQIRVHMSHIKHALLGDATYSGRPRFPVKSADVLREAIIRFKRQALHAWKLSLEHPASATGVSWEVEIPGDMQQMLKLLREDHQKNA